MNKFFLFIFFSFFLFLKISYSNEIFVESEELIITDEPLTTMFIGNVYAFDEEIKLWSDKVLILYTENNNQIDQIKSFGNTKLIKENQEIVSKNLTYYITDKKIHASGNIVLTQDQNVMRGDELNVDLVKSTSIMKSKVNEKVTVKINNNE